MAEKSTAKYAKPASQLDLEARRENGNASDKVLSTAEIAPTPDPEEVAGRSYAVEGNELDNYIGVSPEYQTYANDTEKPGYSEESAEDKLADEFLELMENKQSEKVEDEVDEDEEPSPVEPNSGTTTGAQA